MVTTSETRHRPRVVVGIDGSMDAQAALREATHQAALRDAELDVVHVWSRPHTVVRGSPVGVSADDDEYRAAAEALIDQAMTGMVAARLERRPPRVERIVVEGHSAARRLMDVAKGADLLVVGSRGRGGFVGLLLGWVSQECVNHACCPVMVVHSSNGSPTDDT